MPSEPLFIQFANTIKQKVLTRHYRYGDRFPTEEQLAREYDLNRKTVRKAKQLLLQEGILFQVRGKGIFINRPALLYNASDETFNSFTHLTEGYGSRPESKVLFAGQVPVGGLDHLFPPQHTRRLYRLLRVRLRDGEPIAVEDAYLPADLIPDFDKYDFGVHSLYSVLAEHNVTFARGKTRVSVVKTPADLAGVLGIRPKSGIFMIEFINTGPDERVMEYTRFYSSDDQVDIFVDRGEEDGKALPGPGA